MPRLLDHLDIAGDIPHSGTIGIKPNLVLAKPSESGATTDPRIVDSLIVYLKNRGYEDIVIMESAWVGDSTNRAFSVCGYRDLAKKHGVPLVDLKKDKTRKFRTRNLDLEVCATALDVDYLINIPVLKAHCQTRLTAALKNLKGCIPDREKRRYHTLGLHEPIAALNTILHSDLTIVDGIIGDLTFEEGGTPVEMNRIFAGKDPVLIDAYAATLLGYSPSDIHYIRLAEAYGVGTAALDQATVTQLNTGIDTPCIVGNTANIQGLLDCLDQKMACSACVGATVFAMMRLAGKDKLLQLNTKIKVGQGYVNTVGPGIGVGTCTEGLEHSIGGCPPSAKRIVGFLNTLTKTNRD